MTMAVPLGLRIEIVRCDKSGEYIGKKFNTLCINVGINVEYTATNTPQQNGVSERDGQTLAQITRCVAVGRANIHGGILVQQVTPLRPGRSHAVLQDAQQGGRPLGTASHRSQIIRPPRDLHEEAGRPGVRRRAVRIQSRQQGLQDLQPSQGHGRGKPQRDLFGDAGIQAAPGRHVRILPLRGRRPPIHVSTGRTFDGGEYLRRRRLLLSMERDARMQRLGQEVRRLSRMNVTHCELPTPPQPLSISPGVASDNSGVASPSIGPAVTGEPEDASPGAAQIAPATPAAENAPTASRTGRRLEVTRASTKNSPNDEDTVDSSKVPRALFLIHTMRPDPSALAFSQLLETAAKASGFMIETETADFAHLDGDPFASSRALVYATGIPAHEGISEEGNQPLKISSSYMDSVKSPEGNDWQDAIQKEMDSLKQHDVYKLVNNSSVPKGGKIIGSRFVFEQKADGRFKARLVVQGHVQEPGIDYGRSYAPVRHIGSIRALLTIGCEHG